MLLFDSLPLRHLRHLRGLLLAVAGVWLTGLAQAQFAMVPSPLPGSGTPSEAETELDYKRDAAQHIYASYPMRVYKGRLPPLLYGVMIVETEIDAQGQILDVRVRRPPAAPEVAPWVVAMIRKAAPFPAPAKLGKAVYSDIWLVHKSGKFQLDTLTEGQN
jgi:periplasmic protein TonB